MLLTERDADILLYEYPCDFTHVTTSRGVFLIKVIETERGSMQYFAALRFD